ncbi:prolyl oligopeptidase family serine peptidase [Novosphingobium sp. BL-8A]|uniref:alpha/beta hydrolase family protein n=1 Tax=Novosphingobium sp. BL-8A TaxID=3127639 RepID=UPI003756D098
MPTFRKAAIRKCCARTCARNWASRPATTRSPPGRFAAKADAPVLLIHGKDDTVVAYRQSTTMADALKDAGKPYEMVTLASEDHWLSREETRKRMLSETMRFVQKYNPAD